MTAGRPALSPKIAFLPFWRAWPDLCKEGLMCVGALDGWVLPFAETPGYGLLRLPALVFAHAV